ncbi:pecanex-like protein 4 isoform X1 [Branchiostoma lanceolatum]|uniref:pecanex-like protein 4 isoform X1 n=1 Tax=Branchiostoma lanceolatum TaxID=7740 RepID=UPI0034571437
MGSGAPLLNDYKQDFFWKRFPQTLLGGQKLRLGYDAPAYVYINQLLLFVFPWVISGVFTAVVELTTLDVSVGYYSVGGIVAAFVLIAQSISFVVRRRGATVTRLDIQNILAEDDEVDFESCCGVETVEFVLPGKKYVANIVLHALLSGVMCGYGFWYLTPVTLNSLYNTNTAATVLLYIFGWLTVCTAQFSLTAAPPPEPATFRAQDVYEITPLMRPFYVCVFLTFDLVARFYITFSGVNQVLHVVFIFLPLFWVLGLLPPLDALFPWLAEQVLVLALGGSPAAGDIRLLLMLLLSCTTVVITYFLPSSLAMVITAACCGYLLSLDLGTLGRQILLKCRSSSNPCRPDQKPQEETNAVINTGFGWGWTWRELMLHLLMLGVTAAVATVCNFFSQPVNTAVRDALGYTLIALLVVLKVLQSVQSVYVCFGLVRNPLFPGSAQRLGIFKKRKHILGYVGYFYRILSTAVTPLLMVAYTALYITPTGMTVNTFILAVAVCRALRVVWQRMTSALLELVVVFIVTIALPTDAWWNSLGLGLQLMLVGASRDRFFQLCNKLYFALTILITSWTEKKQRRKDTVPIIVLNCVFFPVVLAMVVAAALLSAPLLPLFTYPLFLFGFPRPMRSWPGPVGSSANVCPDTMYYRQVAAAFSKALGRAFSSGSLGGPEPGSHYLVRYQDRSMWVQVLERGHGFCTVSIKGLELQETSCHTVEAARVDDVFELAFERNGHSACGVNPHVFNTLLPRDAQLVNTYSDARNVLTGIIDSHDSLQQLTSDFAKTLVWVFLHHNAKKDYTSDKEAVPKRDAVGVERDAHSRTALVHAVDEELSEGYRSQPASRRQSFSGSLPDWSDDDSDIFEMETLGDRNKNKVRLSAGLVDKKQPMKPSAATPSLPGTIDDDDSLLKELDGIGLPATDTKQQQKSLGFPQPATQAYKPPVNLSGSIKFTSPYSSALSLPLKWRDIPIDPARLDRHMDKFPKDWYRHVLSLLDLSVNGKTSREVCEEMCADDVLTGIYARLVVACYAVVNVLGLSGGSNAASMGASHVYKVYTEDIPWSPDLDWLNEDPELFHLVVRAYRYAVKLMYDQGSLGPVDGEDELVEYLQEYDRDWYIGCEKDTRWEQAVLQGKPNLFSLGYDPTQGAYTGRVLTQQEVVTHIGQLSGEAVRGQWASLSLELLYFTNDDEERYSIQAHPILLRNLTVQAADPPLGYPVYSSLPTGVPIL